MDLIEDHLELLLPLPPPPMCWNEVCTTTYGYEMLGIERRLPGMLGKPSAT